MNINQLKIIYDKHYRSLSKKYWDNVRGSKLPFLKRYLKRRTAKKLNKPIQGRASKVFDRLSNLN